MLLYALLSKRGLVHSLSYVSCHSHASRTDFHMRPRILRRKAMRKWPIGLTSQPSKMGAEGVLNS